MEAHPSSRPQSQSRSTQTTPTGDRLRRFGAQAGRWAAVCLTTFAGYAFVAIATLYLCPDHSVWPAAGVAFAAGFLGGVAGGTGIFAGTAAVTLAWANYYQQALPAGIGGVLGVAAASGLAAFVAGFALR